MLVEGVIVNSYIATCFMRINKLLVSLKMRYNLEIEYLDYQSIKKANKYVSL